MSRTITSFRNRGFTTDVNGDCYVIEVNSVGQPQQPIRNMCKPFFFEVPCCDLNSGKANRIGGLDYPGSHNGWDVIRGIGQCQLNIPGEEGHLGMIIRDRIYGQKLWYARPMGGKWVAGQLPEGVNENNLCGMETTVSPCQASKMTPQQYAACMAANGYADAGLGDDYTYCTLGVDCPTGITDQQKKNTDQWPMWLKVVAIVAVGALAFMIVKKLIS